ncbi:ABC transporter substrate-binding protein [Epibacterium ulvae]|uniref:heme/hemin ABC transporter substrate-binding protein n=1 Tax=Epibacterium ulvae TaxID=1156985 RepID=UPI001BFCD3B9|nr:ABC transporter substrate-binding protein [Epibacterium ulvae]MBT8155625.1 ABC transporter substrate-binding protein [Epibacterium ulvae]
MGFRTVLSAALLAGFGQMTLAGDVVSVGGAVTEIIYALGEEDRLLARDTTSRFPAAAEGLPDVGYIRALSAEGVLSIGPKLIVAAEGAGPAEAVDLLKAASVAYVEIPEDYTVDGVGAKILAVGAALGVEDKAEALAADVLAQLNTVAAEVAAQTTDPKRVMFVLSTQGGRIMAGGQGTSADAIIAMAGGKNVMQSFKGYKAVTNEAVAAAAPDVIVMMDRGGDHGGSNAELWSMPALTETPAAAADAVVRMDGQLLLGFGPRVADAVLRLHQALAEAG